MPIASAFADLRGHAAMVTGSSSGIGRAIALELARGGADVLVHCRQSVAAAERVAGGIRSLGRQSEVVVADLSGDADLFSFVDHVWNRLAVAPSIWVNNAGADLLTADDARLSYEQKLARLHDVDVRATVLLSREAGRRMKRAGGGVILNIGWDQAATGMDGESGELFTTAKNAVMGFTRSLALNLAPEIRVNCIAPGWIRTAWGEQASEKWQQRVLRETPLRRWGTPEDIAKLARFLVSQDADYLTGQVINANGGAVR